MATTRVITFSHGRGGDREEKIIDVVPEVFVKEEFGDRARFANRKWPSEVTIYNRATGKNDTVGTIHDVEIIGTGFDGFMDELAELSELSEEKSRAYEKYREASSAYQDKVVELSDKGIKVTTIARHAGVTQQSISVIISRHKKRAGH